MKTRTFLTSLLVTTGLVCLTSLPAVAQGGGGGGGGGMGRGMRGGILNEEQQTKMQEAMQASATERTQLQEKLNAARADAVKAALDKSATEASVKAKVE